MPRPANDVYVARESFVCEVDGTVYTVTRGERVRRGHPLLRAQAGSFESVDSTVTYDMPDVEQATAAPGEKRGMRRGSE